MSGNNYESSSAASVDELLSERNPSRRHAGSIAVDQGSDDMAVAYQMELERRRRAEAQEQNSNRLMGDVAKQVMESKDACEFCHMYSFVQAQSLPALKSTIDISLEEYYPQYSGTGNMNLRRHICDAHPERVLPALEEHKKFVEYNQLLTWLQDLAHRSALTTDQDAKTEFDIKIKRVLKDIHAIYTSSDKTKEIIDRYIERRKKEKELEDNNKRVVS